MININAMKTHITLKNLRDSHLRAAARSVMRRSAQHGPMPVDRLVELTLREKAPGYYVSLEHAECMLRLRRTGRVAGCHDCAETPDVGRDRRQG